MLTDAVARRLNWLKGQSKWRYGMVVGKWRESEVVTYVRSGEGSPSDSLAVQRMCKAVVVALLPEAVSDEIQAAAVEDREADIRGLEEGHQWNQSNACYLALLRATPEIRRIVAEAEDRWQRRYQWYRERVAAGRTPIAEVAAAVGTVGVTVTGAAKVSYPITGTAADLLTGAMAAADRTAWAVLADRIEEEPTEVVGMDAATVAEVADWFRRCV
jgi:hypothetical protein